MSLVSYPPYGIWIGGFSNSIASVPIELGNLKPYKWCTAVASNLWYPLSVKADQAKEAKSLWHIANKQENCTER
jgi:hypothetical protein